MIRCECMIKATDKRMEDTVNHAEKRRNVQPRCTLFCLDKMYFEKKIKTKILFILNVSWCKPGNKNDDSKYRGQIFLYLDGWDGKKKLGAKKAIMLRVTVLHRAAISSSNCTFYLSLFALTAISIVYVAWVRKRSIFSPWWPQEKKRLRSITALSSSLEDLLSRKKSLFSAVFTDSWLWGCNAEAEIIEKEESAS